MKDYIKITGGSDKDRQFAEESSSAALGRCKKFFGVLPQDLPVITLATSRKEFEKFVNGGKTLPDWMVGALNQKNQTIYLVSPSVAKLKSKKLFVDLITHEMCHHFVRSLGYKKPLIWLDEGLALNVGKQYSFSKLPVSKEKIDFFKSNILYKNPSMKVFSENDGYFISFYLVRGLIKKLKQKKLMDLLAQSPSGLKKSLPVASVDKLLT